MPAAQDDGRLLDDVAEALRGRFGEAVQPIPSPAEDGLTVKLRRAALREALLFLKEEQGFNALLDIIALDNLKSGPVDPAAGRPRFEVLYQLYQFPGGLRVRLFGHRAPPSGAQIDRDRRVPCGVRFGSRSGRNGGFVLCSGKQREACK